jgi:hypothetical protein
MGSPLAAPKTGPYGQGRRTTTNDDIPTTYGETECTTGDLPLPR